LGNIPLPELRRQDVKNRQNSIPDLPEDLKERFNEKIASHFEAASKLYEDLLAEGIAKECARFVLPLATPTRIYMSGSCRSWIHYIHLRSANGTQAEHKSIAQNCKSIFKKSFPIVSKSLNW
jgi:thymidylate synthase (FAD)